MGCKNWGTNLLSPCHAQQIIEQFRLLAQLLRHSRMHHQVAIKLQGAVRNRQNRLRMLLDDDGRQPLFMRDAAKGSALRPASP